MPPTPPYSSVTGAFTATSPATTALEFVSQLKDYVGGLERELRAYGDANTVGRDTRALQTYFSQIHQCELQIAHAMGIDWTPANWSTNNST